MKYFLKTKGTAKIPDYLQVRDENFQLIAHFQINAIEKNLSKHQIQLNKEQINALINKVPFGKLTPIEELE